MGRRQAITGDTPHCSRHPLQSNCFTKSGCEHDKNKIKNARSKGAGGTERGLQGGEGRGVDARTLHGRPRMTRCPPLRTLPASFGYVSDAPASVLSNCRSASCTSPWSLIFERLRLCLCASPWRPAASVRVGKAAFCQQRAFWTRATGLTEGRARARRPMVARFEKLRRCLGARDNALDRAADPFLGAQSRLFRVSPLAMLEARS